MSDLCFLPKRKSDLISQVFKVGHIMALFQSLVELKIKHTNRLSWGKKFYEVKIMVMDKVKPWGKANYA